MNFSKFSLLITLFFLTSCTESDNETSRNSYEHAIDLSGWCFHYPGLSGKYAYQMKLTQIFEGYAVFMSEKFTFLIPRDHFSFDLRHGRSLGNSAKYVGYVKKLHLKDDRGFDMTAFLYHVISAEEFRNTNEKLGTGKCDS